MKREFLNSFVVCGHFSREFMFGSHLIKSGDTLYKHKTKAYRYLILADNDYGYIAMDMPDGLIGGFLSGSQR